MQLRAPHAGTAWARLLGSVPTLRGDLRGGFASALVGLPYAISIGMVALAPLGPAWITTGIAAGLLSSTVACLATAVFSGTPCQISGPRASVGVMMAAIIAAAASHPALQGAGGADGPRVLGIAMLCLALSGALQVLLGLLRLGNWDRYLPYPVVSGFMVAVGILVAWPQIPALLGHIGPSGWTQLFRDPTARFGDLLVGAATIATVIFGPRVAGRLPAPLLAVAVGTAVHYLVLPVLGGHALGPVAASTLPPGGDPGPPWTIPRLALDADSLRLLPPLLPAVFALALVGSLESLLSSSVLDIVGNTRHDGNRELIGQGLSNIAVAAAGGVPSAGAPFRGVANWNAGGRTRASIALHALMVGAIALASMPLILRVPLAAWAGVLVMVGWTVMTAWGRRLAGCPREDVAIGALVAAVTLALGSVWAIIAGIAGAALLYLRNMSRSVIRGVYDGTQRHSLRVRPHEHLLYLGTAGNCIRLVELQGSLFFGTADRFSRNIEELAAGSRFLVLDLRRVVEMDPTGALVLQQVARRMAAAGCRVVLASVSPSGRRGTVMRDAGVTATIPEQDWFADADAALEWAENRLLQERWPDAVADAELPLAELDICVGMSPAQVATLKRYLLRETCPGGATLFRQGEDGDRLFLLARGAVTVRVPLQRKQGRTRRLATYSPGVSLGEMAVLEGKRRSAEAVCDADTLLYALTRSSLARLAEEQPDLYGALLLNLSRQMASRLRATTEQLRAAVE